MSMPRELWRRLHPMRGVLATRFIPACGDPSHRAVAGVENAEGVVERAAEMVGVEKSRTVDTLRDAAHGATRVAA